MSKIVIIGAGFAGQTAALYLGDELGKEHEITMINLSERFLYVPSLVWVGVGTMAPEKTRFPLAPVYDKMNIRFVHGRASEIYPDDNYVIAEKKDGSGTVRVDYDYLIVATGPKLNFEATPGLGPEHGYTYSICTMQHAVQSRDKFFESVERMKKGERQKIVVGTGHPGATCQGAAFEYITNIHKELLRMGLRDKADLLWLSNEAEVGDFGVRGVKTRWKGQVLTSKEFIEAIFREYDIRWEVQKGVREVDEQKIYWEDYDGNFGET